MRILVVGQGGREHALTWKLKQSSEVSYIACAPGNAGTESEGTNVAIAESDTRELVRFASRERIDLAVIGPEAPLVAGLADELTRAGISVFGPSQAAARLEGSKVYCKQLLQKAKVPQAAFQVFTDPDAVATFLEAHAGRCVVKADGLAAGKGAIVCDSSEEALAAARRMLVDKEFGAAGERILVEERLEGPELSVLALCDGKNLTLLDACQDHKRAFDGDLGPNTGGMGAYCPTPLWTDELRVKVERDILIPTVHELRTRSTPFRGVLYAGLMLTQAGPKVLEYNVRFGDPECQPLLARLRSDLFPYLWGAARGALPVAPLEWDPRPAVCVVVASGGYPDAYTKGFPIHGLSEAAEIHDLMVFHAGTRREEGGQVVTNGGRVLGVTALGSDWASARARAYEGVAKIRFSRMRYRADIADPARLSVA